MAKHVVQRLEEEIGKFKETEIVPYRTDAKTLFTENGVNGESKGENTVQSGSKPHTLSNGALRRQLQINGA